MVNTMAPFSVFTYRTHRLARDTPNLRPETCKRRAQKFHGIVGEPYLNKKGQP